MIKKIDVHVLCSKECSDTVTSADAALAALVN